MVTRKDYSAEAVQAAKSVLIELTHLLGEYREDIVLIGGWVPELIIPQGQKPHVGSMDVDLALNHTRIKEAGYKCIEELLRSRGYYQDKERPQYIFLRDVKIGDIAITVEVDFLAEFTLDTVLFIDDITEFVDLFLGQAIDRKGPAPPECSGNKGQKGPWM